MRFGFVDLTLALYAASALATIVAIFARQISSLRKSARVLLAAALAAHFCAIGVLCKNGLHPLIGTGGVLNLMAFLLAASYFVGAFRWPLTVLGALITPLAFLLVLIGRLTLSGAVQSSEPAHLLGQVHLTLVAVGVVAFALAGGVAVLYLVQEASLRRGRVGAILRRSPAITTLDELGRRLVLVGFPLFTLALISGVAWLTQRGQAARMRPEYVISGLIWCVFLALIVARTTVGLRGRRAAIWTVVGFGATGVVLSLYALRRVLG